MLYWPYKRLELKQGTETYREKEASIMREHIPQSALQGVSCSYRCFWFRYYSDTLLVALLVSQEILQ